MERVVGAAHRHTDAVLVVLEHVAGDVRVAALEHGHAGVAVVVAVVVCDQNRQQRESC